MKTFIEFYPPDRLTQYFCTKEKVTENDNGSMSFITDEGDSVTIQGAYRIRYVSE